MFDFDAFTDLTDSFNDALHAGASLVATGMAVSTVFGLVSARHKTDEDRDIRMPKAIAKLSLLGTLF